MDYDVLLMLLRLARLPKHVLSFVCLAVTLKLGSKLLVRIAIFETG